MISTYEFCPEMDIAPLLQRRPDPTRFSSVMFPEYGDQTICQADLDASALPRFQGQDQHQQSQNEFSKFSFSARKLSCRTTSVSFLNHMYIATPASTFSAFESRLGQP
jgi:hypothetical protein